MLGTELLRSLEMSRGDCGHRHVEGDDRVRGHPILRQPRHEGRMLLEVSDGRAGHEAQGANGFEQHEPVGDFREGDHGRAAVEVARLNPLEKAGTSSREHRLREMINENIGVNKEVLTGGDRG